MFRIIHGIRHRPTLSLLSSLALAACGGSPATNQAAAVDTAMAGNRSAPLPTASPAAPVPAASTPISSSTLPAATPTPTPAAPAGRPTVCSAEIGRSAAEALARQCRRVSPATRPPCNAANSCAIIRDEIARGCALLGDYAAGNEDCPASPRRAAAVDAVQRYYAALNAHDFGTAYIQWADEGQASGKSRQAFEQGFAHTRRTHVNIGQPGRLEGAAGSLYVTVPVTVDAVLDDGRRQHFTGKYVLRQVNGLMPMQGWHIHSATLKRAD